MHEPVALSALSHALDGGVHQPVAHDSAVKHVTGTAVYVDDIPTPPDLLHLFAGSAAKAHARLRRMDLSAVRAAPGVALVLTAEDIPGRNDISPLGVGDDPVFCAGEVMFHGQVLFAVAAESFAAAREAAKLAVVEYEELPAILTIEEALAAGSFLLPPHVMRRGDSKAALAAAPHRLRGRIGIGGQDHFYLEGQVSLALPMEDGDVLIHCSTQHPSEVQHGVARVLGRPDNAVTVEVRRMGGGFGGKETQAAQWAAIAALAAVKTGRPVKFRLERDDDMIMTGKRHDFLIDYDVGFDSEGRILGIEFMQASRGGCSADLTGAIADRAMFHADNGYYLENVTIVSHRCRTHTVSNTAFRGFGGPQGMLGMERVIEAIARYLGKDQLEIRKLNLYGVAERNVTPYHQTVEDNLLPAIIERLEASAGYRARRAAIAAFNEKSPWLRKGLALTPVKFGISFTTTHLNQAGALLHVYSDGSVHLNHGGTEMGQGLFVKVAQVVAEELQVDLDRIKITATNTGKVPNTSATAASASTDLNGMAVQRAAREIKGRLARFASETWQVPEDLVSFRDDRVFIGNDSIAFGELAKKAYAARVHLSAAGFYKTPKLHWDRDRGKGRPFYYYAYGAACSEVLIDILTGEMSVRRVDILHDVGRSINPAIDIGQIEGGFVQGMGWLTTEELVYDEQGRLLTHAPSTYKIPVAADVPTDFRVSLFDNRNREETIYRSKAVGEPPLMLAISVFAAIADAVHSVRPGNGVALDAPATPEAILKAVGPVDAVAALAPLAERVMA
ncbi:MAG TPA: xanthine dehydrogenase molybdopterin binding subunit [Dongiaceae bacterium]|nr:xanthine dehydrogenase molybdopterin binding subunit [Dongiaceae bacterium]